ncbi:MAG: CDP-alcohol phosphatidyltransferase family protein [Pseudomonadota bacterium]
MLTFAAATGLLGLGLAVGLGMAGLPVLLPVLVFLAAAGLAGAALWQHYPHDRLGLCNLATLLRLALAAAVASAVLQPEGTGWAVAGLAAAALLTDGVDGWLARRSGLRSRFGGQFDMEVDAGLGLALALFALTAGKAGPWVLGLGVLRYLWILAGRVFPWLTKDLPESLRRKAVCVLQIGALLALATPPVTGPLALAIGLTALALLLWSFAVDAAWLWRRRP